MREPAFRRVGRRVAKTTNPVPNRGSSQGGPPYRLRRHNRFRDARRIAAETYGDTYRTHPNDAICRDVAARRQRLTPAVRREANMTGPVPTPVSSGGRRSLHTASPGGASLRPRP